MLLVLVFDCLVRKGSFELRLDSTRRAAVLQAQV